jgi:broad specificity phosphatase PhoE
MAIVRLVRHGQASAGWGTDPDPDLDDVGRLQANNVAEELHSQLRETPAEVWTSPLLRCQSTARPFVEALGIDAQIVDAVREIPSPRDISTDERIEWLRGAMEGTWSELGGEFLVYRDRLTEVMSSVSGDTVVFSHFIAINAVIGACLGDDRLVIRHLDNTSVTIIDVTGGVLTLVEGGNEAETLIR